MTGAESIKATNVKSNSVLVRGLVSTAQDAKIEVETPFANTVYEIGAQAGTQDLAFTENGLKVGDQNISGSTVVNADSKTLSESLLGSVAFVNQGAEFIADEGMGAINATAREGVFTAFGAMTGGRSRYVTGSHVSVKGVTLAAGTAGKIGNLTLAGFVEAGWADSDSHVSGTDADGDHDYYGIGAAARYDFVGGFYVDGSLRLGMASTEFNGKYSGSAAHYDADSFYTSAHIGSGYVYPFADSLSLNVYGRYVVTYLDGDDVGLGTGSGEKLSLDSTVTHALRIGGRLTGHFCEYSSWRAGLAYEHVFDGDAESDLLVGGTRASLDTPSLEGNSGILELGVRMTPSVNSPWSADIGLKGYVGDREGATGSISVLYRF